MLQRDAIGRIRWTGGTLRRLYERRRRGESTAALAREVGCSSRALRTAWEAQGLMVRRCLAPPEEELLARWDRHLRGERTEDLAAELGIARSTLAYHWRRLGKRPTRHKNGRRLAESGPMMRAAWGLKVDGQHTWAEIAAAVGYDGSATALRVRVLRWRRREKIGI